MWFFSLILRILCFLNIIILNIIVIKDLLIIYKDKNIWECYFIIAGINIRYKKK